jgi:hypothetical protein
LQELQNSTDELEKECLIKKEAFAMMPSAADNIGESALCIFYASFNV